MEQKETSNNLLNSKLERFKSKNISNKGSDSNSKFTYRNDEKQEQSFSSFFTAGKEYRFFDTQISYDLPDSSLFHDEKASQNSINKVEDLSIEKYIEGICHQPKELLENNTLKKDEEKIEISFDNEEQLLDLSLKTEIRIYSKTALFITTKCGISSLSQLSSKNLECNKFENTLKYYKFPVIESPSILNLNMNHNSEISIDQWIESFNELYYSFLGFQIKYFYLVSKSFTALFLTTSERNQVAIVLPHYNNLVSSLKKNNIEFDIIQFNDHNSVQKNYSSQSFPIISQNQIVQEKELNLNLNYNLFLFKKKNLHFVFNYFLNEYGPNKKSVTLLSEYPFINSTQKSCKYLVSKIKLDLENNNHQEGFELEVQGYIFPDMLKSIIKQFKMENQSYPLIIESTSVKETSMLNKWSENYFSINRMHIYKDKLVI